MIQIICRGCKTQFSHHSRGRPPVWCQQCKAEGKHLPAGTPTPNVDNPTPNKIPAPPKVLERASDIARVIKVENEDFSPKLETKIGDYKVVVTNLGVAFAGDNEKEARTIYERYVKKSNEGYGQVGHEQVTLMFKAEVLAEYLPGQNDIIPTEVLVEETTATSP